MELRVVFRLLIQRSHGLHAPHRGVVELVHSGQCEGLKQPELGHHVRPENLGQLLGDGDEHRYLAATDLLDDRLGLTSLASRLHGAV
jgi:hypothetical protein